jgi:hypothetical protein
LLRDNLPTVLIRQEQLDALRADRLERFIRQLAARTAAMHPDDDPFLRAREAVERSLAVGIEGERDVTLFAELLFRCRPRFEEAWVGELLGQTSMSGSVKVQLLRVGLGVKETG